MKVIDPLTPRPFSPWERTLEHFLAVRKNKSSPYTRRVQKVKIHHV